MGDIISSQYRCEIDDGIESLLKQRGFLPQIIQQTLTKDLDFHQKEHLKK